MPFSLVRTLHIHIIVESLQELSRLLLHMSHPEIYQALGVSPPRGILLHGPPGCGKTLLGCAIAGQLDLPLLKLVGPELVTGVSGESERRVRDLFDAAIGSAPCVLFIGKYHNVHILAFVSFFAKFLHAQLCF